MVRPHRYLRRCLLTTLLVLVVLLTGGCADSLLDASGNAPNPAVTLGLVTAAPPETPAAPSGGTAAAPITADAGTPAAAPLPASPLPANTPTPTADSPEGVVRSFYTWYLDQAHSGASPLSTRAYQQSEYLSPALIAHVDDLMAASPDHGGYDPFLCAQTIPDRVEIGAAQSTATQPASTTNATATVTSTEAAQTPAPDASAAAGATPPAAAAANVTAPAPVADFSEQVSVIVRNSSADRSSQVNLARSTAGGQWQIVGITCAAGDAVGQAATPAGGVTALSPEQTVQHFYDWYLASLHQPGNPLTDGAYKTSPYLSSAAVQSISQLLAAFGNGPSYDPILCAQNAPVSVTVGLTELAGDEARVFVRMAWGSGADTSQTVQLKQSGGQWQIISLTCAVQKPAVSPTP
jgi:hypothetical protein